MAPARTPAPPGFFWSLPQSCPLPGTGQRALTDADELASSVHGEVARFHLMALADERVNKELKREFAGLGLCLHLLTSST